jgi:hypothetical protein
LWGAESVGVQDEESWFEAVQISNYIKQSGAWFTLVYEDGTEEKFQRKSWIEKLSSEKFRARVLDIMDKEIIKKFDDRSGHADDYYDIGGEDEEA